jgi:alpha-tubulin suppressor-like RCC1 family protein
VKDLSNVKMISCGSDHFLALSNDGKVYAMGDDTFGQCGQSGENRSTTAPFFEKRYGKPLLVALPEKVVKIVSGYRHNMAITDQGNLFGWGYNNQQQLSYAENYAQEENPWHAIFTPMLIKKDLEGKFVTDAACGEEFSLILCKNPQNNDVQEVYGCGNNLRGQLGINRMSHLQDLTLIEDVSGFVDMYENKPLSINNLTCGRRHCVATFDYGAFFIWGDNEFGQLGDKKRRFLESPFPKSKFERKHNVENVVCGIDNCAVIVEDRGEKAAAE